MTDYDRRLFALVEQEPAGRVIANGNFVPPDDAAVVIDRPRRRHEETRAALCP